MPKVYGTGTFDFRRHRVAEYAADNPTFAPPPPPPESIPASTISSSITLVEIQRDRLTKIAGSEGPSDRKFDPELVKEIYESELLVSGGRKTVTLQRVRILEVSQYLENYLWPNFDPETATFEHVMSMILMVNEKDVAEVVEASIEDYEDGTKACEDASKIWMQGRTLSIVEMANYLLFMINAFQSLEDEIVSETVLKLVSLQLWHCLSFGRFQMELCLNLHLIKKWKKLTKREARKAGHPFDPSKLLEVTFLRNLIEEFLEILDSKVVPQRPIDNEDQRNKLDDEKDHFGDPYVVQIDDSCVLYCERFMEFLIDLLSQLPTRRFLKTVVADVAVVAKCHLSALYLHEKGRLFAHSL